jgi:hypothetical protein
MIIAMMAVVAMHEMVLVEVEIEIVLLAVQTHTPCMFIS